MKFLEREKLGEAQQFGSSVPSARQSPPATDLLLGKLVASGFLMAGRSPPTKLVGAAVRPGLQPILLVLPARPGGALISNGQATRRGAQASLMRPTRPILKPNRSTSTRTTIPNADAKKRAQRSTKQLPEDERATACPTAEATKRLLIQAE